jgi:hypothetical protein
MTVNIISNYKGTDAVQMHALHTSLGKAVTHNRYMQASVVAKVKLITLYDEDLRLLSL